MSCVEDRISVPMSCVEDRISVPVSEAADRISVPVSWNVMDMNEREVKISELAKDVLELARESILVKFRFFDGALSRIVYREDYNLVGCETRLNNQSPDRLMCELSYSPEFILNRYKEEPAYATRLLLHVVLHILFLQYRKENIKNEQYWDIAADIAAENVVLSLNAHNLELKRDNEERLILTRLSKWISPLTAEKIYREFMVGGISDDSKDMYGKIFAFDIHPQNTKQEKSTDEKITISQKDFEEIARKLSQELKSFSKDVSGKEALLLNLKEGTRKHYDYDEILRVFAAQREVIKVNPDEFDYVYYTYGLEHYKNMPLIEPLEYTEEKKIREFVIAIDTSASVRGDVVEGFLQRTYDILEKSASFSENLLVHLIQCDSAITEDYLIKSKEELKRAAEKFKVKGFGATDFRPVFNYVEELIAKKELTNLKGLIYFTDGYGIYPEKSTKYDTMFVFTSYDDLRPPVPGWAIKVVLSD